MENIDQKTSVTESSNASPLSDESLQPLTRGEASEYLRERWGLSYAVYTLAAYAARGTGPEYSKAGPRAMYTREALDDFAKTKLTGPSKKASDLKPIMETENGNA
jgi:hypothetical protein